MSRFGIIALAVACGLSSAAAQDAPRTIEGWGQVVDPDGDCAFTASGGKVTITVPATPHDLSVELGRMNAPRVLQTVEGDFRVEVTVSGTLNPTNPTVPTRTAFQGAGLLMMLDERTYLRLERAALVSGGRLQHYVSFELREDGKVVRFARSTDYPLQPGKAVTLRFRRLGGTVVGAACEEDGEWRELRTYPFPISGQSSIGVAAVNASTNELTAEFSGYELRVDEVP